MLADFATKLLIFSCTSKVSFSGKVWILYVGPGLVDTSTWKPLLDLLGVRSIVSCCIK